MENNKHPRRIQGRGILDVHPTQLRRGEGADIKPEQLHILSLKSESSATEAEKSRRVGNNLQGGASARSAQTARSYGNGAKTPSTASRGTTVGNSGSGTGYRGSGANNGGTGYQGRGANVGGVGYQGRGANVGGTGYQGSGANVGGTGYQGSGANVGGVGYQGRGANNGGTGYQGSGANVGGAGYQGRGVNNGKGNVNARTNSGAYGNSEKGVNYGRNNAGNSAAFARSSSGKSEAERRNIMNLVLCGIFCGIVVLGALISFFHMINANKPTYSEFEKRPLEKMPEFSMSALADGSYTQGIDRFFSDNFPMREGLVKGATVLKRFKGVRAFDENAKQVIHGDSDIYTDGEMEISVDENKFNNAEAIVIPSLDGKGEAPAVSEEIPGSTVPTEPPTVDTSAEGANSAGNNSEGQSSSNGGNNSEGAGSNADIGASDTTKPEVKPEVNPEANPEEKSEEKPAVDSGALKGDKRDTIYIIGDTAYEYFRGSEKSSNDYINVVNTYAKYISENVNIFTLVIPTHPEFGLTGADRSVSNDQKPVLDYIGRNLDPRVKFVNPHENLKKAYENGEYLYFRTDHHWTIRGAYQAYLEFCEVAGFAPITEDKYEKGRVEPFLGTFYSASGKEPSLSANPDFVEYFKIDIPCTVTRYDKNDNATNGYLYYTRVKGEANAYLAFMGSDFPYIKIKTENTNGRKLMMFKESFGNPLIGLLAPHFEEIHVADIRYFKYNSINFISQYGITDVLFCNGIMSANSKGRVNDLMQLMNK